MSKSKRWMRGIVLGSALALQSCATPALWDWADSGGRRGHDRAWRYTAAAFLTPLAVAFDAGVAIAVASPYCVRVVCR